MTVKRRPASAKGSPLVWIDIDNAPQVQYLLPFVSEFEGRGYEVALTARNCGISFDLLRERGIRFTPVGMDFGRSKYQKVIGTATRAIRLVTLLAFRRPKLLLCSSRSSALAARLLCVPAFVICDYEYVELGSYRRLGAHIVHPEVIGREAFVKKGFALEKLIPFRGIKEDLSFSAADLALTRPHVFSEDSGRPLVLFRPPAVEGHYYESASGQLATNVLSHLATREDATVVFSPRYQWQLEAIKEHLWKNSPILLKGGIEFTSLLMGVDAVIASGGTMAREAAYLGIPAYSIFKGKKCAVDRHLEALGRLTFVDSVEQMGHLRFTRRHRERVMKNDGRVLEELAAEVLTRVRDAH